ncbi:unnamed protein product [Arabidopsis halleri]
MTTKTLHLLLLLLCLSYLSSNCDATHLKLGITMHIKSGPSLPCGAPPAMARARCRLIRRPHPPTPPPHPQHPPTPPPHPPPRRHFNKKLKY